MLPPRGFAYGQDTTICALVKCDIESFPIGDKQNIFYIAAI
jgi:hypothetical protein